MRYILIVLFAFTTLAFSQKTEKVKVAIENQESGVKASFRGVSAVNNNVVWVSGSGGTVLKTLNGGSTWDKIAVAGNEKLDFRDIEAFSEKVAYIASAGSPAKILKTIDGGASWITQFADDTTGYFFDSFDFWDENNGIVYSDPVKGKTIIFKTTDGGKNWKQIDSSKLPAPIEGESAFAASGTMLITSGKSDVWIGTGGKVARVFHSANRGVKWEVFNTEMIHGGSSNGIFSIAVKNKNIGIIVGGDYQKDSISTNIAAVFNPTTKVFKIHKESQPIGFKSAVDFIPTTKSSVLAVGTSGVDISNDNGKSWQQVQKGIYNALSFSKDGIGWIVGGKGLISKVTIQK